MKTLKISEETHLKLKKLQLYYGSKTIDKTILSIIHDAILWEFTNNNIDLRKAGELGLDYDK